MLENTNEITTKHDERAVDEQIAELRNEIDDIVDTIKNFNVDGVKRKIGDIYQGAKNRGSESYYDAKDKLGDLQEQLCEEVKAKPMQSVAIAAGIGFLLGVICRR